MASIRDVLLRWAVFPVEEELTQLFADSLTRSGQKTRQAACRLARRVPWLHCSPRLHHARCDQVTIQRQRAGQRDALRKVIALVELRAPAYSGDLFALRQRRAMSFRQRPFGNGRSMPNDCARVGYRAR